MSAVSTVVVGHWAQNAQLSSQHFTVRGHNFLQFQGDSEDSVELMKGIIQMFSYEGQFVLELLSTTGKMLILPCTLMEYKFVIYYIEGFTGL